MNQVAENYAEALQDSNVKYVVNLSSVGADVGKGVGPVDGLHYFEKLLNAIPRLNIRHLRPSYFYSNFLAQIGMIKQGGIMGGNFGEGEKIFLTHTSDIAVAASEELLNLKFSGNSVRYIISDERSGNEIAQAIGNTIGMIYLGLSLRMTNKNKVSCKPDFQRPTQSTIQSWAGQYGKATCKLTPERINHNLARQNSKILQRSLLRHSIPKVGLKITTERTRREPR